MYLDSSVARFSLTFYGADTESFCDPGVNLDLSRCPLRLHMHTGMALILASTGLGFIKRSYLKEPPKEQTMLPGPHLRYGALPLEQEGPPGPRLSGPQRGQPWRQGR